MQFSSDIKLPHNLEVKRVLNYLKGTSPQGLIINSYPEEGIECYVDPDFAGGWNQEEGKDPGLVLSITGYIISYTNCPIIWASRIPK